MSGIDADLGPGEREALIDEVAAQLPLWLQRAAEPRPQAVDQLVDLLGFTAESLRRVRAVHALLSDGVTRLLAALPAALRSPRPASERPVEIAGVVRGPVDWAATARLQAAGLAATFVVMPRRRVFDTSEHRALAWVLHRLDALCAIALQQAPDGEPRSGSWTAVALHVRRVVAHSRRVAWLEALRPERPDHRARTRIRRSRNRFAAGPLSDAIDALIDYESAEGDVLAALIAERYFTPEADWRLFEVVVLIRIDRALAAQAGDVRRYLMSDAGVVGRYTLPDGDRVELRYQGWGGGPSRRAGTLVRHGLPVSSSRPDILVERSGAHPDLVVLELKASRNLGTIGDGLSQLLGYLNERPERFATQPAGWLVPLPFDALEPLSPDPAEPLWIVPADSVADAIVTRMAPTL